VSFGDMIACDNENVSVVFSALFIFFSDYLVNNIFLWLETRTNKKPQL